LLEKWLVDLRDACKPPLNIGGFEMCETQHFETHVKIFIPIFFLKINLK
jgi:hypothetical protein